MTNVIKKKFLSAIDGVCLPARALFFFVCALCVDFVASGVRFFVILSRPWNDIYTYMYMHITLCANSISYMKYYYTFYTILPSLEIYIQNARYAQKIYLCSNIYTYIFYFLSFQHIVIVQAMIYHLTADIKTQYKIYILVFHIF